MNGHNVDLLNVLIKLYSVFIISSNFGRVVIAQDPLSIIRIQQAYKYAVDLKLINSGEILDQDIFNYNDASIAAVSITNGQLFAKLAADPPTYNVSTMCLNDTLKVLEGVLQFQPWALSSKH